jgi:hypothetical protein
MDPEISHLNDEFKNLSVYPNKGYTQKISEIVEIDLKNMTIGKKTTFFLPNTTFFERKTTFFGRKNIRVDGKGISKKGI